MLIDVVCMLYAALVFLVTLVWRCLRLASIWATYNQSYTYIQRTPQLRHKLRNDPGVKFMRMGWSLVWLLLFIVYCVGMFG